MLRGLIKNAVAVALDATRAERFIRMACGSKHSPLVVGYHQVVPEFRPDWRLGITSMQTSCNMLEHHLDWIGSRYDFVSLDEIGAHFEAGMSFSRPVAAVTFDDGYRSVYSNAFPILKRKGIPAAVFAVTDIIGTDTPPLHDRLYSALVLVFEQRAKPARMVSERLIRMNVPSSIVRKVRLAIPNVFATMRALFDSLRRPEIEELVASFEVDFPHLGSRLDETLPMTWEMLAEMNEAGITIGSHTKSHALLTSEEQGRVLEEVIQSRDALQRNLGVAPRHFAYPDGRFNVRTAKAVSSAYQFGYTVCRHQLSAYPLMTIPRKMLWENSCTDSLGRFSPAVMNCQVHGIFDWISGCDQVHGGVLNSGPEPVHASDAAGRPSSSSSSSSPSSPTWHGGWDV